MTYMTDREAADLIRRISPNVTDDINQFMARTFKTRGGRMGSGMGLLLEGLWGYTTTQFLADRGIEISWIAEDQYNDYAVTHSGEEWDVRTGEGELLRIEAKTMNLAADETKGHFAELSDNIAPNDLLLVMLWRWEPLDENGFYVAPRILDVLLERARPIAKLRDQLHEARGGTFVSRFNCPDECSPERCSHHGEPLNASGKRERVSGPEATRPSNKVSFANNFGGLKRMLATRTAEAKELKRSIYNQDREAAKYIDFLDAERIKRL